MIKNEGILGLYCQSSRGFNFLPPKIFLWLLALGQKSIFPPIDRKTFQVTQVAQPFHVVVAHPAERLSLSPSGDALSQRR
jgi:hypothetical protein